MKKILLKYVFLVVITFLISINMYSYIGSFTSVSSEEDVLIAQKQKEDAFLSNTNYQLDNPNVILNPYGNCPLSAIVIFQTKDLTTPTITVKGKDGASDVSHTFTPSKEHILPIYGLYADYDNTIIIEASGKTKELKIKTDKLPDDFVKTSIVKKTSTSDFYFTTPENSGYTAAYDGDGEVRWYVIGDYKWDIQRLGNGHILMSNDKTISGGYSAGLTEMDLLGKVYFEYLIPGGYHHNVYELNSGNLLVISNNVNSKTVEDFIVEVDRSTGEIVKEIDLNKILKNKKTGNWFRATSLFYDVSTNSITVSGYNSDMIVNIDYASLNVNWLIGNKIPDNLKSYALKADGEVSNISNPLSVKSLNGNEFIFVNTGNGKISTYKIDYSTRTYKEVDSIDLSNKKDAYLEIDDNYIITQDNNIKEIKDDDVLFELDIDSPLYNTKKMGLYANDIFNGVMGSRLGTLGESKREKDHFIINPSKDKSILKKYNVKLKKDELGLKISGDFEKAKVQIILDNVLDKKTYNVVGNSRYINEDGIKGKYYIYLKINGKTYKIYKYAIFY